MKKRILSILVICCMVLGLLPTTAFADNDSVKKAIQIGTSGISGYDSTNSSYDYIHFGTWNNSTVKWRVLDTKTNMANAQRGDGFFLLSEVLLGTGEYGGVEFDYTTPYFNDWKGSRGQDWCNDFYSRSLSITEQKAVLATSKSDALYGMYYDASDNILDGDKVFFLSAEEAENAAYGFTDDNARIANYGDSAYVWWLRSPRRMNPDSAGTVNEKGAVIGEWVGQTNAARPAFNLKPDSVLLVSAAVGGKGTADGMFKIPEYSGDEWKLTLLDDTRTFRVTETTAAGKPGGTVTLNFSGPRTGQNEYISAIIEGKNGATYYGRIMKPTAADRQLSFTLPHDLASGNYKLHVFSEQYNGDYQTDYASQFQTVALTVEEAATEQFALTPGGTYYFDLSGANIPGTANGSLPDSTLHYVPFTYTGTVYAYSLSSNSSGVASSSQAASTAASSSAQYGYARDHSLFIADYAVAHTVSWLDLNAADLIFGKDYASGKISYALRAPSVGSNHKLGSDADEHGDPENNEWDAILNKARQDWQDNTTGYIKNWKDMYSTGQDTAEAPSTGTAQRMKRGYPSVRRLSHSNAGTPLPYDGFRPVLEVLRADMLGSDALKTVALDLNGGSIGDATGTVNIVVKNGESFTAPSGVGLTRPSGNTDSYFWWLGSDGKSYVPGAMIPAGVASLTAQWTALTYSVTLHENGGTLSSGNVTSYNYGEGATLPTAGDMTREGYTFAGWYDNEALTGTPVMTISNTEMGNKEYWAQWEINQYTVTVKPENGESDITITQDYGTPIAAPADPTREGYTFIGWDKAIPTTMPAENMTITAKWKVNQYTITFDTNGGSEITPITQDYGTAITAPANPTREGYTFIGWDKAIPATMPAENMIITAKWKVNQYTITFDSNGGSEIAHITQDYGTAIAAPADPTREGYTFIGWDKAIPTTMPAENMTVTAQWEINQYTITFDTAGGSEIAPITQDYGTAITTPADPTREGYTFIGWDTEIPTTMPAENMTVTAQWKDIEKPTGEIKISENSWKAFLNNITFGLFFKDTQTVTITAADNSGETVTVEYLLSAKELTKAELDGMTFTAYTAPFGIDPDNEYIIYVRLTDKAGNTDYICSDGIVLDGTSPVITGIEDGKIYCEAQTVTVDEKYVNTITVNGTEVTLDENNSFTLAPANGEQRIVVTDKAGNTAEMTVTVNDGHTYGEWVSNGDGTHTRQCTVDGCNGLETKDCSGGKATCAEKAVCEVCGKAYGEVDPKNHTDLKYIPAKAATEDAEGNIEYWHCGGCDKYYSDKDGTKEIKKADTVTAKLPKSPPTGDTSNLMLWIALLFISGGVLTGVTVFDKRKRHSAK